MDDELILCIPGTWKDRSDFVRSIVAATDGTFAFAGAILADSEGDDHVALDFRERDEGIEEAFGCWGSERISAETLRAIAAHGSVVYLHFPMDILEQRERIVKFTEIISRSGGIAIKVETCGCVHEWDAWLPLMNSDDPFDSYCAGVVLVGDDEHFHSSGMQGFGLPDVQISTSIDAGEAAEMMNQFNIYRIVEMPSLESGDTFSLAEESPRYGIELVDDTRHPEDSLFHNPHGIWELRPA